MTTCNGVPAGWVNYAVTLKLSATDQGSGIGGTYYTIDSGPKQTYDAGAGIVVTKSGVTKVEYWSDHADPEATNLSEEHHVVEVRIDRAGPDVAFDSARAEFVGSAKIVVSAADAGSGFKSLMVSLDGEPTRTVAGASVAIETSRPGTHAVTYSAVDSVGNVTNGARAFTVKRAQTVAKSPSAASVTLVRARGIARRTFSAVVREPGAGPIAGKIVQLQRSLNGKTWANVASLKSDSAGRVSRSVSFRTAGTTYWRWYSPGTSSFVAASSSGTRLVVR